MKILGFGLMRPPMKDEKPDVEEMCKMVDLFMERGFTYFDTALVYFNGESERMAREALVKRYPRESYTMADKLPMWRWKEQGASLEDMFSESLENTGLECFDYYLIHSLTQEYVEYADAADAWGFVARKKEEGKVRHIGFSFHDTPELLDEILTKHPEMEFVQLQINYADWENERVRSRACYEVARKHGKPVAIMEPVKGGNLATLGDAVSAPFKAVRPERPMAEWAVRFAASLPGVMIMLSGMSSLEQVDANTTTLDEVPVLSDEERAAYTQVQELMANAPTIPCTGCGYCMEGCPIGMKIPRLFRTYNELVIFGNEENSARVYDRVTAKSPKASECLSCYSCAEHCPQHLEIPELLAQVAAQFEK